MGEWRGCVVWACEGGLVVLAVRVEVKGEGRSKARHVGCWTV